MECLVDLPSDKHDVECVERLVKIGYPGLAPVLPALLEWVKDLNWPVAKPLNEFFVGVGLPLEAYIRMVLLTDDNCWKRSVLIGIVSNSPKLACALKEELQRIAAAATSGERAEELNLLCAEILESLPE